MLRWKTLSAICAIVVAACPLTSFAQQIAKPAPPRISVSQLRAIAANQALRPGSRVSQVQPVTLNQLKPKFSAPNPAERVASPEIIVRTPFVQPQNPNLYLFVVQNVGTVDATAASVDLYVPSNVTITKVFPASATINAQQAHVRLKNLAAGSMSTIEVEISPTNHAVEFQTRISLESVHTFTPAANSTYVASAIPLEASKYLIPTSNQVSQVSHVRSPLKRLAPVGMAPAIVAAANNANAARAKRPKSAVAGGQASVDAKLLETVESLRLAGQDALADAYIAAFANSGTYRAETF